MNDQEKHRQAGLKALALAKKAEKLKRKPIYLQKGVTGEMLTDSSQTYKRGGKKMQVNTDEVKRLSAEGKTISELANKYRVCKATIYNYLKR